MNKDGRMTKVSRSNPAQQTIKHSSSGKIVTPSKSYKAKSVQESKNYFHYQTVTSTTSTSYSPGVATSSRSSTTTYIIHR